MTSRILRPLAVSALLGAVALITGYLAPLYLNPQANQGPLFGIFVAAPAAVAAGLLAGALLMRASRNVFIAMTAAAALLTVAIVLYFSLP